MVNVRDPDNQRAAKVNMDHMMSVVAVSSSVEHYINHAYGDAFNVLFSQSPAADNDCIFYLENTSESDIVIEGITLSVDAACEVYIKLRDVGTRNGFELITPVNCNAGSGHPASGVFEQGVDLDGGSATLSGGAELERFVFIAASNSSHRNFEQDFVVPKNRTFTVWCSSSSATVTATVPFNYHDKSLV